MELTAAHVRAAMQSAAGTGLKCPSPAFEEYVAAYLNRIFGRK
jgi:hypothetical protein